MEIIDKKQCFDVSLCPICGGRSSIIDTVKTINPNCSDTVNLRDCSVCRHWWIDPLPKQDYLSQLYAKNSLFVVHKGYDEEAKSSQVDMELMQKYAAKIFRLISKPEKFNFLEIGVGHGHTFKYFEGKSNLCYGVEPGCWRTANPNIVSDIENIPKDIKFDIMVIQDVLEHLTDPVAMLTKLKCMASKDCVITSGFPNKDSIAAQFFKGNWRMVRPLGHIHFFSSRSIVKAFNENGWKIVVQQSCRPAHIYSWETIKQFDWKLFKDPLRGVSKLIRRLIIEQLILEKDQWFVQARAN